MVAIIDYGLGNLKSIYNALLKLGISATVTSDKRTIEQAERVILPGVGAFAQGMRNLRDLGLIPSIRKVVKEKKPFLGICLGLQLLFTESEEYGLHRGLGILEGKVKKFTPPLSSEWHGKLRKEFHLAGINSKKGAGLKIPHMGWNSIKLQITNYKLQIFKGIPDGAYFYFVHSYYVVPKEKKVVVGTTEYGEEFVSVVQKDNLFGVQFHPERSGPLGLKILKNFSSY